MARPSISETHVEATRTYGVAGRYQHQTEIKDGDGLPASDPLRQADRAGKIQLV